MRAVQARAVSEPDFGAEFSLREEMEAFPRKEAKREMMMDLLKSIGKEYFEEKIEETPQFKVVRNNLSRWIALAASVTLIGAAIWFFSRTETAPTYQQYAQHTPLSLTVMGNTEQSKTDAQTAFDQKDYARALAALEQVLASEPENIKAKLYQGICLLELKRSVEARAVLEPLSAGNSALREDANWYIGLSYLQENNTAACKTALAKIAAGEAHYKDAQEILNKLSR